LLKRQETFSKFQETASGPKIKDFGTRGPRSLEYTFETKYLIPIGFKSVLKINDTELIFSTRASAAGPEFRITSSGLSPDWTRNVRKLWDLTLSYLKERKIDTSTLTRNPLVIFGVTEGAVQSHLNEVEGVLYCQSGELPSLEEYETYLGIVPEYDSDFRWIICEFRNEALPVNWYQYVSEKMAYWVNAETEETVWKHPLFDKYRSMLLQARVSRPRDVTVFEIELFFSRNFESEISRILDFARILKIDLKKEPYLVHVVLRALKHYFEAVAGKLEISRLADFQSWIGRYRKTVSDLEILAETEIKEISRFLKCVDCSEKMAEIFCEFCEDFFCPACFNKIHKNGRRESHPRTMLEIATCSECELAISRFQCVQCQDAFCEDCLKSTHQRGGRRNHVVGFLKNFKKFPGRPASRKLETAKSPWVRLRDEGGMNLFYNFQVSETCRDLPLDPLNEIIEY